MSKNQDESKSIKQIAEPEKVEELGKGEEKLSLDQGDVNIKLASSKTQSKLK